jgi:hypothetical protein
VSGRARPVPAALDTAEQLRQLVREAHAAAKDLRHAIREAQQLAGQLAAELQDRAEVEYVQWVGELQAAQNRHAADLNAAIVRARDAIIQALTLAELEAGEDFKTLRVKFRGPLFDADANPRTGN